MKLIAKIRLQNSPMDKLYSLISNQKMLHNFVGGYILNRVSFSPVGRVCPYIPILDSQKSTRFDKTSLGHYPSQNHFNALYGGLSSRNIKGDLIRLVGWVCPQLHHNAHNKLCLTTPRCPC